MLVLLARDSLYPKRTTEMVRCGYVTFFEFTAMLACRKHVKSREKKNQLSLTNRQYVSALGGRYWKMDLNLFQSLPAEELLTFAQYVLTTQSDPGKDTIPTFNPTCLVSTPERPWLATFIPGYLSYQSRDKADVVCVFVAATKYTQLMSVSDIAGDQYAYLQFVMLASGTHTCFLVWKDKEQLLTHLVIQRDCLVSEAMLDFIQHNRTMISI
jgi:hypothetical protein